MEHDQQIADHYQIVVNNASVGWLLLFLQKVEGRVSPSTNQLSILFDGVIQTKIARRS